ncbi:cupin domain-containing protein [Sorangium sp. So ce145]|uniref:cupin domain-containing protein n=1 Tax=Sorangium sp. So ce145 TaxID=3133285 RepID=UPI003F5F3F31
MAGMDPATDFTVHRIGCGSLKRLPHPTWPCELWSYRPGPWQPPAEGTHYGAVFSGRLTLRCRSGVFEIGAGMVFCVPGELALHGEGEAFGITHLRSKGFFQIAGPIEASGRLRYIDGCTDSLLIAPQVRGDPCLNHLHFPPRTDQTLHTHPSLRAGLIARGRGVCRLGDRRVPLSPGLVFHLPPGSKHAFQTEAESMDVVAFHPDSDFGPVHDDHPMINRTIVDGISARHVERIRTAEQPNE